MLFSRKGRSGPMRSYLIIPVDGPFQGSQVADSARQLIQAASNLAQGVARGSSGNIGSQCPDTTSLAMSRWHTLPPFPPGRGLGFISS